MAMTSMMFSVETELARAGLPFVSCTSEARALIGSGELLDLCRQREPSGGESSRRQTSHLNDPTNHDFVLELDAQADDHSASR
jgi:hypothetical protein